MMNTQQQTVGRRTTWRNATRTGIPDGIIGLYFTIFPIAIALFLSVQAVRAEAMHVDGPVAVTTGAAR